MSLILDALRKLERDKDPREPGVLVVGAVPWGARTRSRRPLLLALAGIGLVVLLAFALWRLSRSSGPGRSGDAGLGRSRDPGLGVRSAPDARTFADGRRGTARRRSSARATPPAARPEPVPVRAAGPVAPDRDGRRGRRGARDRPCRLSHPRRARSA